MKSLTSMATMNTLSSRLLGITLAAALVVGSASRAEAAGQPGQSSTQAAPAQNPQRPGPPLRPGGRGARMGQAPPTPPNADSMSAAQVEQYFDGMVLWQARTALQLEDEQFFRFGTRLERLQMARRRVQRQRQMLIKELNDISRDPAPVDEAAVAAKIKTLDDLTLQASEEIRTAYAGIDQVLNARQRARFRGFEEMMERQKLQMLARARDLAKPAQPQTPQGAGRGPGGR